MRPEGLGPVAAAGTLMLLWEEDCDANFDSFSYA